MKIQVDDVIRDATPEEETEIMAIQKQSLARAKNEQETLASAIAKLKALGLSDEEIAALR